MILGIEPQIRGVLLYHFNGEILGGGMRDGVESYLPLEEITKSTLNTILEWKTRELLYPFLGIGRYSMTEYEKIKRITIPLNESVLLIVATEVEIDHDIIIKKILQLINKK
jgi:hypothetical protein